MSELTRMDADLHLHGPNSTGVSKHMNIPVLAEQAKLKGLQLLSTGDILSRQWLQHCQTHLTEKNGKFFHEPFGTHFILGTEVIDNHNVHHLLYFPDFNTVEIIREKFKNSKLDGPGLGRPHVNVSAEKLAEIVFDVGGELGPAHAYTPYFSIYSRHNSLKECYGKQTENVKLMELGLSADTNFSDLISGNHSVQYLTCSDCHSPWPERLGREFTRFEIKEPTFAEFKKALHLEKERKIALNVGLDPREGKYHCTACNGCYAKYPLDMARSLKMKCSKCDGGIIKRGVRNRIMELADTEFGMHPSFRPNYVHIVPLAELIRMALNGNSMASPKVQEKWRTLVSLAGSEIKALIDTPIEKLAQADELMARKINAFRQGWVLYIAGGGGNYGVPVICDSEKELEKKKIELKGKLDCASEFQGQKMLKEF